MAVAGVRVEGDIADHADCIAVGRLYGPNGAANQVSGLVASAASAVFLAGSWQGTGLRLGFRG